MADASIRKYNKWTTNPNKADARVMEQERQKLRTKMDEYQQMSAEKRKQLKSEHTASDFKIGDTVHVISMDTTGSITAPGRFQRQSEGSNGYFKCLSSCIRPRDY